MGIINNSMTIISEGKESCAEFAKRLNYALDLRKYPPLGQGRISYLQEIFELSRAGANKWLHGKAIPHKRKREEIAEKLGISLTWLETGEGDPIKVDITKFEANNQAITIPLLSMAAAYNLEEALKSIHSLEKIVVGSHLPQNTFAVKLMGKAMFPKISEKSLLLVSPNQESKDGDIVLATCKSIPESICRQYIVGSNGEYLIAINPNFDPIQIGENAKIIGKVIEIRTELL